jgi:hypothetical protein
MKETKVAINAEAGLNSHLSLNRLSRIVSIMTSSRTGSSLMSSLLDSHPCILSFPDDLIMDYYKFWLEHGHLPIEELVKTFIDYYAVLFDARKTSKCKRTGSAIGEVLNFHKLGEKRDRVMTADVETFKKSIFHHLSTEEMVTRRSFFQALHIAYADATGHRVNNNTIIAFGLHGNKSMHVRMLIEDFPDTYFIHMVREPVQTVGSQFRHYWEDLGRRDIALARLVIVARFLSGSPVREDYFKRSRAVRLEDLCEKPKKVMLAVCGWLGIPWSDSLLKTTVNGLTLWTGKGTMQVSGFNKAVLTQKHISYLSRFDKFRLKILFHYSFSTWGYFHNSTWLGGRIFKALVLPFMIMPFMLIPFKTELLILKNTTPSCKNVFRYVNFYTNTRLFIIYRLLNKILRQADPKVINILSTTS